MARANAVFDSVIKALEDIAPTTQRSNRDVFRHHEGWNTTDAPPKESRLFSIEPVSHDRVVERMGGNERTIVMDVVIAYAFGGDYGGGARTMLEDGDDVIDALVNLKSVTTDDITKVVENGSQVEINAGWASVRRQIAVSYYR